MDPWSTYRNRTAVDGSGIREDSLAREKRFLSSRMKNSLSFHKAYIDGENRSVAIINSDNLNVKTICSLPGEELPHGGLVLWMEQHWLITDKDYNTELYTKAKMKQCNYYLRWIAPDGNVVGRWCIVEDGTKYLTGEYGDRNFVAERGDSRVAVTMARDEYTALLGRENRFLIDDPSSKNVLAYQLTKPFKLGNVYGKNGVVSFVLTECNTEDTDNLEERIANYYRYFPKKCGGDADEGQKQPPPSSSKEDKPGDKGAKGVWI